MLKHLGKVRFFVGEGEGWGVLVFFPKKSVGPLMRFNKLLTPHLEVTDKSATLPSLLQGMFHAVET